jgi:hypothetical protein
MERDILLFQYLTEMEREAYWRLRAVVGHGGGAYLAIVRLEIRVKRTAVNT